MPESSPPALIAFYGLLMRAGRAQQRLRLGSGLRYVRPCRIPGRLLDLGSYPGLIKGPGTVRGELYEILDSTVLSALDRFEDYDPSRPRSSEYLRRMRTLAEPRTDAWVYLYNRAPGSAP